MNKNYTDSEKTLMDYMRKKGHTLKEISEETERSIGGISRYFKRSRERNSTKRAPVPGRPRALSAREMRRIIRHVTRFPKDSSEKIKVSNNLKAATSTIRAFLNESGIKARLTRKVMCISEKNRIARMKWCLKVQRPWFEILEIRCVFGWEVVLPRIISKAARLVQ